MTLKHQTELNFAMYRRRTFGAAAERKRGGGLEGPFTWGIVFRLTFFLLASLLLLLSGFLLLKALSPASFADRRPLNRDSHPEVGSLTKSLSVTLLSHPEVGSLTNGYTFVTPPCGFAHKVLHFSHTSRWKVILLSHPHVGSLTKCYTFLTPPDGR
jgi:hypothetical protein